VLLIVGFLNPLGAAGVVGVMSVAFVTNHRPNGFFIFRPGEGYEYVLNLLVAALALGALGAGEWSIDHRFDGEIFGVKLYGWSGLAITAIAGLEQSNAQRHKALLDRLPPKPTLAHALEGAAAFREAAEPLIRRQRDTIPPDMRQPTEGETLQRDAE